MSPAQSPTRFGTTLETIPANVPYLHADEAKIEQWRPRLQGAIEHSENRSGLGGPTDTPSRC